nr:restriction endonuclease subunit S [Acinetobacter indicus]
MVAPKLRFKEFDGDWKQETLKNLATFSKGKGISKADISEDGINLCIRYGELYTTYGQVIDHIHSRTNVSKSECILSKAGDVIIPASGETQIDIATASCVLHDDIILSGDLNILSHEENGSWLAYYLSSAKKLEIAQLAQGNSVVHLYSSQLKDLKINKPSKEEQTKIASFLSAVDEKISQLTQKHELLSQYKQGMMQKLFSQQIRFKADDGSEFGEWEETTLGALYNIGSSKRVLQEDWKSKGIPFLRTREIISLIDKTNFSSPIFIAEKLYDELTNKYGAIKENDILVSGVGTVGKAYIVKASDKFYFKDGNVIWLRSKELNNSRFIYYFFQSHIMENYFVSNKSITTVDTFTIDQAKKVKLLNPSIEEQTKIANFLSIIDQKIEVVAQQIEQAKQWKKGLLQQMFV